MWDSLGYPAQEYSLLEHWQTGAVQSWGKAMRVNILYSWAPTEAYRTTQTHWFKWTIMQLSANGIYLEVWVWWASHRALRLWQSSGNQRYEGLSLGSQSESSRPCSSHILPRPGTGICTPLQQGKKGQNLKHNDWVWKQKCCESNRISQAVGAYRQKDLQPKKRIPRKLKRLFGVVIAVSPPPQCFKI